MSDTHLSTIIHLLHEGANSRDASRINHDLVAYWAQLFQTLGVPEGVAQIAQSLSDTELQAIYARYCLIVRDNERRGLMLPWLDSLLQASLGILTPYQAYIIEQAEPQLCHAVSSLMGMLYGRKPKPFRIAALHA
jgi:hypothetical protein